MKTRQEIESIARQKKRFRLMLIFSGVLAVFIGASIALIMYFMNQSAAPAAPVEKIEIMEWESYYRNYAIAYPQVDDKNIVGIQLISDNEDGEHREYYLVRNDEYADGEFLLYYKENGENYYYLPPILDEESDYEYGNLYAKETGDGYGVLDKIYYLLAALEIPYFGERIPLSDDATERNNQLRNYGFASDDLKKTIRFDFKKQIEGQNTSTTSDDKYEEAHYTIHLGDKTLAGSGYYFMLEDENHPESMNYVYNSNSNYYDYALLDFYSFVNGRLVAAGLKNDASLEPTLTTNFTHWKNETFNSGNVEAESKVVILSNVQVPIDPYDKKENIDKLDTDSDGYIDDDYSEIEIDLAKALASKKNALTGKAVGKYADGEFSFTLTSASSSVKGLFFDLDGTSKYLYTIYAIESILEKEMPDGTVCDDNTVGAEVGENKYIKISYKFSKYNDIGNFERVTDTMCHAVLDLTNEALPEEAVAKLRASSIGELKEPVEFTISYTKENAFKTNIKLRILEIIEVLNQNEVPVKNITEQSIVGFRYCMVVNGVEGEIESARVNLKDEIKSDYFDSEKLKELLVGKTVQKELSIDIYESDSYFEVFYDFETYEVEAVEYFVTSEEIVSFRFLNSSERDPFYGESIYENKNEKYELYNLNSDHCEYVVKILGGVGNSDSTTSEGLVGETVDVGITPFKMQKYGLYSHTVYFEVPREIIAIDSGDEETIDDYASYSTLGVTLYVSDESSDGMRYVGSDLFDVIVKIDGENFDFVDSTFVDYWARRNLVLTDVASLKEVEVEFSMEDLKGEYKFVLDHRESYIVQTENGYGLSYDPADAEVGQAHDMITVKVLPMIPVEDCTSNTLVDTLKKNGWGQTTLTYLYNMTVGGGKTAFVENDYDFLGTGEFKNAIMSLYFVQYEGIMSAEEQAEALANGERVMKFSFFIDGKAYKYSYEFYRCGDRRVLVSIYKETLDGEMIGTPLTDFYVSTFAFKKIVGNFITVLNGETVDLNKTYY